MQDILHANIDIHRCSWLKSKLGLTNNSRIHILRIFVQLRDPTTSSRTGPYSTRLPSDDSSISLSSLSSAPLASPLA